MQYYILTGRHLFLLGSLALSLLFVPQSSLIAQQLPLCQGGEPLASSCGQSCILCDLDGYTNTTTIGSPGAAPAGFCTQVVHTIGWVGFVAGSTDLGISVEVFPCVSGTSIEMGIYAAPNCTSTELVSNCNTAMFQNNTYFFNNTEPLTPGCVYFLVFDNNGPAACPFTVTVVSGSATAPVLNTPPAPEGPTAVCPGATVTYSIPPQFGSCEYVWIAPPGSLINGAAPPVRIQGEAGATVDITFGSTSGNVCVQTSNPCNQPPPACLPVTVAPIPPTVLPPESICNGEVFEWIDGNSYASSQTLSITLPSWLGCDSVVRQQLIVRPPIVTNLGTLVRCEGDCVEIGGVEYCAQGFYQITLPSYQDCDSNVVFSLLTLPIQAVIALPDTLNCTDTIAVLNGGGSTGGSTFSWYNAQQQLIGTDSLQTVSTGGLYTLVVTRVSGSSTCRDTATVLVPANFQLPDVQAAGDTIGCAGAPVQMNGTSMTPDARFFWSGPGIDTTNQEVEDPIVGLPGVYILRVTNPANGCWASDTADVVDLGPPPVADASGDTLDCLGPALISALSQDTSSTFNWVGPLSFSAAVRDTLTTIPGLYIVTVTSLTGCTASDTVTVVDNRAAPLLTIAVDTIRCNHPFGTLTAQPDIPGTTFLWTGPMGFSADSAVVFVSSPGLYVVQVTAPNGCMTTDSVSVQADTLRPDAFAQGGVLDCFGNTTMILASSATAGAVFSWTGPGGFSAQGANAAVSQSGNYILTVTAPNGCTTTATAIVTADAGAPAISLNGLDTLNCLQTTLVLSVMINPTNASVTWTGPGAFMQSGTSATISAPGIYTVAAQGANGCVTSLPFEVAQDTVIPLVAAQGDTLRCSDPVGTLTALSADPLVQLDWSGPAGFTAAGSQVMVQLPGLYSLKATAANGCTATTQVTVEGDFSTPNLNAAVLGSLTCTNSTVPLIVSSQSQGTVFSWNGPSGFLGSDDTLQVAIPGIYRVIATGQNGCMDTIQLTVPIDTVSPVFVTQGGVIDCAHPTVQITASSQAPGITFGWTGPGGFIDSVASPTVNAGGIYTVTATGLNGCTSNAPVSVGMDFAPPVLSASVSNVLTCSNPQANLSVQAMPAAASIQWAGPAGFTALGNNVNVSIAGNYSATVTALNGCTAEIQVTVLSNQILPDVQATGDTLDCSGNGVMLTGFSATAGVQYSWTGPGGFVSSQATPVVLVPGQYQLVVRAPNGCTSVATATAFPNQDAPDLVTFPGGLITCLAPLSTLMVQSSVPGVTFNWSGPAGFAGVGNTVQVGQAGSYTVTALAPNGCAATDTLIVSADLVVPDVLATGGIIDCAHPMITITGSSGIQGAQFQWSGPGGVISNQMVATVNVPGAYVLRVTGPNGCSAADTVIVSTDLQPPVITVAVSDTLDCNTQITSLNGFAVPPTAQISWQGPAGYTGNGVIVMVSAPGLYLGIATSTNGCRDTAIVSVVQDLVPPMVAVLGDTIDCYNPQGVLSGISTSPGASFFWTGPGNFSTAVQNPVVSVPGNYFLTVTGANGCTASSTTTVYADTIHYLVAVNNGLISCTTPQAALLSSTSAINADFSWSGPGGFQSVEPNVVVSVPGAYRVVLTGANGCTSDATAQVTADTLAPFVQLSAGNLTCRDTLASVQAYVTPSSSSLQWSGPQSGLAPVQDIYVALPGVYTLVAMAANGCITEEMVVVEAILPEWTIELGPDTIVFEDTWITVYLQTDITQQELADISWTPTFGCYNCPRQVFRAEDTTLLSVRVEDVNGCFKEDGITVFTRPRGSIYVPNVFSPDDDGLNDVLRIYPSPDILSVKSFDVYDRWGTHVFSASDFYPDEQTGAWDGRFRGERLQPAVFVWIAEVVGADGVIQRYSGDVLISK